MWIAIANGTSLAENVTFRKATEGVDYLREKRVRDEERLKRIAEQKAYWAEEKAKSKEQRDSGIRAEDAAFRAKYGGVKWA